MFFASDDAHSPTIKFSRSAAVRVADGIHEPADLLCAKRPINLVVKIV
jgi:hypothetical protein